MVESTYGSLARSSARRRSVNVRGDTHTEPDVSSVVLSRNIVVGKARKVSFPTTIFVARLKSRREERNARATGNRVKNAIRKKSHAARGKGERGQARCDASTEITGETHLSLLGQCLSLQGRARRSRSRMFRLYPRAVCTPVRFVGPLVSDTQPSCVAACLARRADAFGAVASGESD